MKNRMDIETTPSFQRFEEKAHTFVISAKFSADLTNNRLWIEIPYQIPNCVALKVEHFAMVDDGTPEPISVDGGLLVLISSLADHIGEKNRYIMAETTDQHQIRTDIYNNVIAWTSSGRRMAGGYYPIGMPQRHPKLYFASAQMIQVFSLSLNNVAQSLQPHTTPYTMEIVLTLFSQ